MKKRQIIYSSTIIVLGIIQLLPCVLLVSGTIIGNVLGIFYALFVWFLWTSTKNSCSAAMWRVISTIIVLGNFQPKCCPAIWGSTINN